MENTVKKVYADNNGAVTFVCPNCGAVQKDSATTYKSVSGPIKIHCKCGETYSAKVEFRKSYRKETRLQGSYSASNPRGRAKIIVKNLSLDGCGFETLAANALKPDQEIQIEFVLNDIKSSQIIKRAVVCIVEGHYVGCKFKELPGAFDPDLGFYLRSI